MRSIDDSKKYLSWEEFFRFPQSQQLSVEDYFRLIKILKPLLLNQDYKNITHAFYINYIKDDKDENFGSLRIRHYTTEPQTTYGIIEKFLKENSDKIVKFFPKSNKLPDLNQTLTQIQGEGLRFVKFLHTNTEIVIDLLESYGEKQLQKIVLEYRFIHLALRVPPETIFEPVFEKYSNIFKDLKNQSLDKQYWEDLIHVFNSSDFGLHFLANMVNPFQESFGYDQKIFQGNWFLK